MKPIEFEESNTVFAAYQPQYLPLPAFKSDDGKVISCWKASFRERLIFLFTGKLWLYMLTFNKPLQPQRPLIDNPWTTKREKI